MTLRLLMIGFNKCCDDQWHNFGDSILGAKY